MNSIVNISDINANCFRGLEVDDQIEFHQLHHRQIDGLLVLVDAIYDLLARRYRRGVIGR
jgi:hypothetical protein